jgi:hypothetical protein
VPAHARAAPRCRPWNATEHGPGRPPIGGKSSMASLSVRPGAPGITGIDAGFHIG